MSNGMNVAIDANYDGTVNYTYTLDGELRTHGEAGSYLDALQRVAIFVEQDPKLGGPGERGSRDDRPAGQKSDSEDPS